MEVRFFLDVMTFVAASLLVASVILAFVQGSSHARPWVAYAMATAFASGSVLLVWALGLTGETVAAWVISRPAAIHNAILPWMWWIILVLTVLTVIAWMIPSPSQRREAKQQAPTPAAPPPQNGGDEQKGAGKSWLPEIT